MFKKIITFFVFFFLYIASTSAISIPVEQVFSDIKKDYKYYNELQDLYDKGMIFPDSSGKLNPNKLLSRDEFVGIAVETSCTKCISPNTDLKLLQRYTDKPFFDVQNTNKYKYCISYAKDNSFVAGYDINHKCIDGTYKKNQNPFCTSNNISLEESLAVILRMSGILSSSEAENIRQRIRLGETFPDLAIDVKSKNLDGSVYSFYPDFFKALSYEIIDYDASGNKKIYKLLEKNGDYLRPDRYITKEEFLLLAYKALKANSCIEKQENNLALEMQVFDKNCTIGDKNCTISDLQDKKNIYDFVAKVDGICDKGINENNGYIWRFYNETTDEQIKRYGKYLDNYKFLKEGKRTVFLRVIDNCGNTAEVQNIINIGKNFSVSISADPIYGAGPLESNFKSIIGGNSGPYTYKWDFGDGNMSYEQNSKNVFKEKGVYEVFLYVTDKAGNIQKASVIIYVTASIDCSKDSDSDSVGDCEDKCPLLKGSILNSGCPIFEKRCNSNCSCDDGYVCNSNDKNTCSKDAYCIVLKPDFGACVNALQNTGFTYGNAFCQTCPCGNYLDFKSVLRTCDSIFPAITSPDEKVIYGKGDFFQIK